jgi:release factor glutamine methyltransferase
MVTWRALRAEVSERLREAGIDSPVVEARWITETASGAGASEWAEIEKTRPTDRALLHAQSMTSRRAQGEPLQYALGSWSFRGLDLMVDARVLIPRPETEWVVEIALREAERIGSVRVAVDLGTGSGAIALALAAELPGAVVWATDVSGDALAVATANIAGQGATRVRVAEGDWFAALPDELVGTIDVVVTNPPYVSDGELATLSPEVRDHEPRRALVSGPSGLEAIAHLVDEAPRWLAPSGVFVCELAPAQAVQAIALARRAGLVDVVVHDDLAGRPRVLVGRRALDFVNRMSTVHGNTCWSTRSFDSVR